jgi:hypothetical protein
LVQHKKVLEKISELCLGKNWEETNVTEVIPYEAYDSYMDTYVVGIISMGRDIS